MIQKHLLLISKIYSYNSRRSQSSILKSLIREIAKVKNIDEKILINNEKNILCTRESSSTLKIICRPKILHTLPDSTFEW